MPDMFDDKYVKDTLALAIFLKKVMDAGHDDIKYIAVFPNNQVLALAEKLTAEEEQETLKFLEHLRSKK